MLISSLNAKYVILKKYKTCSSQNIINIYLNSLFYVFYILTKDIKSSSEFVKHSSISSKDSIVEIANKRLNLFIILLSFCVNRVSYFILISCCSFLDAIVSNLISSINLKIFVKTPENIILKPHLY